MAVKSIISRLENRIDQLISDHQRLSDQCRSLQGERDTLLRERRDMQEKMKGLEHQLSVLELCEGLGSSPSQSPSAKDEARNKARARVNRLMREVDKCINLLSATQEVSKE